MPEALKVVAWADNKEIMAVEHKEYAVFGLQFHPESILTPNGKEIIANFMKLLR
jgi:anthranilate synthase component 2